MTRTIDEMKAEYKHMKAKAVIERRKLEEMRVVFSKQCKYTQDAEVDADNLKRALADELMKREGLEP